MLRTSVFTLRHSLRYVVSIYSVVSIVPMQALKPLCWPLNNILLCRYWSVLTHTSVSGYGNITSKVLLHFLITPKPVQIILNTILCTWVYNMWWQAIPYVYDPLSENTFMRILIIDNMSVSVLPKCLLLLVGHVFFFFFIVMIQLLIKLKTLDHWGGSTCCAGSAECLGDSMFC